MVRGWRGAGERGQRFQAPFTIYIGLTDQRNNISTGKGVCVCVCKELVNLFVTFVSLTSFVGYSRTTDSHTPTHSDVCEGKGSCDVEIARWSIRSHPPHTDGGTLTFGLTQALNG